MLIEFDPTKDAINTVKHKIGLEQAVYLDWDSAFVWLDDRFDYGEKRMCALGYIHSRLFHVVFVDRELKDSDTHEMVWVRRIISLRRANKREEKYYAST